MDRERIEGFVRSTLGCTCPAEIFARIEDDPLPAGGTGPPIRRIAIGGRLLIYLVDVGTEPGDGPLLDSWVLLGLAERKRLGMKRFRLVLAADKPNRIADSTLERFQRLTEFDDKVHLHVVANSELALL